MAQMLELLSAAPGEETEEAVRILIRNKKLKDASSDVVTRSVQAGVC